MSDMQKLAALLYRKALLLAAAGLMIWAAAASWDTARSA